MPRSWQQPHAFKLTGGVWFSNGSRGEHTQGLKISVDDALSGTFMFELNLSAEQFMSLLRGSIREDVPGTIASEEWRDTWGHKRWTDEYEVPADVIGALYGDAAEAAAGEWFEGTPGSIGIDGYWVRKTGDGVGHRKYTVFAYNWLSPEEYAARQADLDASEDVDDDEEGFDDEFDDNLD